METTKELEDRMDLLGNKANEIFPDSCSVMLIIDSTGAAHYLANMTREDAIEALKTLIDELEKSLPLRLLNVSPPKGNLN